MRRQSRTKSSRRANFSPNLRLSPQTTDRSASYSLANQNPKRSSQYVSRVSLSLKNLMNIMEPMSFKIRGIILFAYLIG